MRSFLRLFLIFLIFSLFGALNSCTKADQSEQKKKAAQNGLSEELFGKKIDLRKEINAFPAEIISSKGNIDLEFKRSLVPAHLVGETLAENPFQFEPELTGVAKWLSRSLVRFIPDANLKPGQTYKGTFIGKTALGEVVDINNYQFQFKIAEQELLGIEGGYEPDESGVNRVRLHLKMHFAQGVKPEEIRKDMSLKKNKKDLVFSLKSGKVENQVLLVSNPLQRTNKMQEVELTLDKKFTVAQKEIKRSFSLAAKGVFKVLTHAEESNTETGEMSYAFRFSDPLRQSEDLSAWVRISPSVQHKVIQDGKYLRVNGSFEAGKNYQIKILKDLPSAYGTKLAETYKKDVRFSNQKPQLEWLANGVFLPSKNNYKLQMRSVNLKQIQVRVTEIYSQNLGFFLQNNQLKQTEEENSYDEYEDYYYGGSSGFSDLNRTGKQIYSQTIELGAKSNQWHKTELDLSKVFKDAEGSAFVVQVNYGQNDYLGRCTNNADEEGAGLLYFENEDYYKNPCNYGYINRKGNKQRLVVASSVGLTLKKAGDSLHVYAVNVETAEPLAGLQLSSWSYLNKELEKEVTDRDGHAVFAQSDVHLIRGESRHGLALIRTDQNAWETSRFGTSGVLSSTQGLSVFSYTDRGVHRPGDTIYYSAIIRNDRELLPEGHPVSIKVTNSKSQQVFSKQGKTGAAGHVAFAIPTGVSDPTGAWNANLELAGNSFNHTLRVETVKPNRLKVKMKLPKELTGLRPTLKGEIETKYLFGTPASGLKAKVSLQLSGQGVHFEKFPEFTFKHPAKTFNYRSLNLFDGVLNEQGIASLSKDLPDFSNVPEAVIVRAAATVFEKGGGSTKSGFSTMVYPYSSYVGVASPPYGDIENGKKMEFPIVTLSSKGEIISGRKVRMRVYSNTRYWWWHYNRENRDFRSLDNTVLIEEKVLRTASSPLKIEYTPEDNGRHFIEFEDLESGHMTGFYFYASQWANGGGQRKTEDDNHLEITVNKNQYQVGDSLVVGFEAPEGALALVTIEQGQKILQQKWVNTKKGPNAAHFIVGNEAVPNVYAVVSLMQKHGQNKNDQPMRLYGVRPVSVEDPNTRLAVSMTLPKSIRPGEEFSITLTSAETKDASVTVSVVDEGLLDLTNFATPDPWKFFFQKIALGVVSLDNLSDIIGSLLPDMDSYFSIGGGGESESARKKRLGNDKTRRFKAVSLFSGVQILKAGETKTIKMTMPNYVGSVRAMMVAASGHSYASREKAVPVKKPVMVLPTVPRVGRPGDVFDIPVSVFAMETSVKEVKVELQLDEKLEAIGPTTQTIQFSAPGEQDLRFKVKVGAFIGATQIKVKATSGKEVAFESIDLPLTSFNPFMTRVKDTIIQPGQSVQLIPTKVGLDGTNEANLRLGRMPDLRLNQRLDYLIRYPYGCIEQTVSSAFPQLYVSSFLDLSPQKEQRVSENIKQGILRLRKFIVPGGGFAYWPYSNYYSHWRANDWGSLYAGHFLIEAKEKGYDVPQDLWKHWLKYQVSNAKTASVNKNHRYQAYRLYLLARAEKPEMGAMNLMRERSLNDLDPLSQNLLAAAYHISGKKQVAQQVLKNNPISLNPYRELSGTFGSAFRDRAMMAVTALDMKDQTLIARRMKVVMDEFNPNSWYSTQETAVSLLALGKFLKSDASGTGGDVQAKLVIEGKSKDLSIKNSGYSQELVKQWHKAVVIENKGGGPLFVTLSEEGIPLENNIKTESNGINLSRNLYDSQGRPMLMDQVKQGEPFWILYTIKNRTVKNLEQMALSSLFPSGWEIVNPRMSGSQPGWVNKLTRGSYTYMDIRDDRVNWFFDMSSGSGLSYAIQVEPTFAGEFQLPPVAVEAMYSPEYYGRIEGGKAVLK